MNFTLTWCCLPWHDSTSSSTNDISLKRHAHFFQGSGLSWSVLPNPAIRKSSAITSTPSRSSTKSCIVRCQTSGAEEMPNGILFHRWWSYS